MKKKAKIIISSCYVISAICLISFILIAADYEPAWLQSVPYRQLAGAGLFFLPVTGLWTLYYLFYCAAERKWKLFASSLTGIAIVCIITTASALMLIEISVRNTDRIALEVLNGTDAGYQYDVHDDAMSDFRAFQERLDLSSVRRMSAFTPYSRYDYIIMPESSAPFIMTIFKYDKSIMLTKAGVDNALERKNSFVKID